MPKVLRFLRRSVLFVAATICFSAQSTAQSYPRWFLFPESIPCSANAVGYVHTSYYQDSAFVRAFRFACEVYAINQRTAITGTDAFWATEGGTVKMGSEYEEQFDTAMCEQLSHRFAIVDKFVDSQLTIVLAADSTCLPALLPRDTVKSENLPKPDWVTTLPTEKGYAYAIGLAERYYYEASSWNVAEQHARLNLARQKHSRIESLQKSNVMTGESLQRETVTATLEGIRIVARWRDPENGILYVLSRIKL
jgi:hypothetical protein